MFLPDSSFKGIILQELDKEDRSISSLHRALREEGHKVHRLVLTGYLKAMEDMQVLRAKDIPPSKVYSISVTAKRDIYESVGGRCRDLDPDEKNTASIAMYIFQRLFKRSIFLGEMRRAGFGIDMDEVAEKVTSEERLDAKKMLANRGHKLPHRDPAYKTDKKFEAEYEQVVHQLILERFEASSLALETKQLRLGI